MPLPLALIAAINILGTVGMGFSLNNLFGNRLGNLVSGKGFKSNYDLEMNEFNKNNVKNKNQSNTKSNTRGGFFGIGGNQKTTGEERRRGILSFLGDRSRKLDDAPDIVEENQQVLSGIDSYSGLLPPITVVPNINNERILDLGFEGVRKEIEKINGNIDAIRSAMIQSALLESSYRGAMIESMRRDLAEKGKDRSDTRTEKSIFNLLTRSKSSDSIKKNTKSLSDRMQGSLGLALGLELANFGMDAFGGENDNNDNDNEDGENTTPPELPKVGDYYFVKDGRGGKYYILQPSGNFKKVNRKPSSGKLFNKSDFNPKSKTSENTDNSNLNNVEPAVFSEVSDEEAKKIIEREDRGIFDDDMSSKYTFLNLFGDDMSSKYTLPNPLGDDDNIGTVNNILNSITPMIGDSISPVEPGSGSFEFIDLRTSRNTDKNTELESSAGTQLNNEIPNLEPAKTFSIYESFVKN